LQKAVFVIGFHCFGINSTWQRQAALEFSVGPFGKEFLFAGLFAFAFTRDGERVVVQQDLDLFLLQTRELYDHRELVFVLIDINRGPNKALLIAVFETVKKAAKVPDKRKA
jgi:hypothetical protein